jgi:ankyrin repeat protein
MLNLIRGNARLCCFAVAAWLWLGVAQAATPGQVSDFFRAVRLDDPQTVRKLLAGTMSPNAFDPVSGETGLIVAVREGSTRVFEVLIARPDIKLELNAPNGNTALMMAAFKGDKPALLALLAKGAIVNRPGWTALHYAAASGENEIVRILLEHYAYIDAESPSKLTPLMIAAREGHELTAQLLLEEGADATLKNNESLTAVQIAERADKPLVVAAIAAQLAARRAPGK